MSLIQYFFGRSNGRHTRSGLATSAGFSLKKLRDRDESGFGRSLDDETIGPLGIIFSLALISAVTAILDYGVLPPTFREKTLPSTDIRARLNFSYNDLNQLNHRRDAAAETAARVYVGDPVWVENMLRDLTELMSVVEISSSVNNARERTARISADGQLVEELFNYNGGRRNYLSGVLLERIRASLQTLANNGVLSNNDFEFERNKRGESRGIIRVVPGQKIDGMAHGLDEQWNKLVPIEKLGSVINSGYELVHASWNEGLPPGLIQSLKSHMLARLTHNLKLDTDLTNIQQTAAMQAIGNGDIQVKQNDLILSKNLPVTTSDIAKLHEEYRAYKNSFTLKNRIEHILGQATIVAGVLLSFILVVIREQKAIFLRRRALVMLALLSLLVLGANRALMLAGISGAWTPFVFVAMVTALAFGQTVAMLTLFGLTILTVFSGIHWEASALGTGVPALSVALMTGGMAAALPTGRLHDRWDLLEYGAIGGGVQGLLVAGASLLGGEWGGVPTLTEALLALINGPVCGLLVLGSLPMVESLFEILTNIRLFELADMNQPALRRIQLEAPGTFAHTLQVRFLAEPAADAIGANTRLVSAGVLYHDLGKTLKPEYFVENQLDAEDRHRRLRPSVSALLITAHVKDGIELAHEYDLPQQIIDFIPEHHGTTLVSYFYHSAKKNAESEAEAGITGTGINSVQEAFFRYPGPKPRSRETAIVMLADTVEAASRTMSNPSAARLRVFVHDLVMDKMLDGQLDESNLTFADLAMIENAFLRVLATRFHSRIRYPGQQNDETTKIETPQKTTVVAGVPL